MATYYRADIPTAGGGASKYYQDYGTYSKPVNYWDVPSGQVLGASTNNLSQPTPTPAPAPAPSGPSAEDAARQQAEAELAALNSQYNYNNEQLNAQLSDVNTQKATSLSDLSNAYNQATTQVNQSKTNAQTSTQSEINKALSRAQDVQKQNRNVLRALGILSSSAGAEMLNKPYEAYDQTRGELGQALNTRLSQLDDYLTQKANEQATAVRELESNYASLTERIRSDLRFNDRQRADAVKQLNAAMSQRLAEYSQAMLGYKQAVETQKANLVASLTSQLQYQQPTANLNNILSQAMTTANSIYNPVTVGVSTDDERKRLSQTYGY
jgi:hypothetical protein